MPSSSGGDPLDSMSEAELRRLLKHMRTHHPRELNAALDSLSPARTGERQPVQLKTEIGGSSAGISSDTTTEADDDAPPPATNGITPQRSTERVSPAADDANTEDGCYMVYDSDGAKLTLQYSRRSIPGAVGFFSAGPGHKIQAFKFSRNQGRSDLIKNCASGVAGRKNYYSGWCQFVRAAKALDGSVTLFPIVEEERMGLDVDVFVYRGGGGRETVQVPEGEPFAVGEIDAVACLPKHAPFYTDLAVDLTKWMTEASAKGAATAFVEIEASAEYKSKAGNAMVGSGTSSVGVKHRARDESSRPAKSPNVTTTTKVDVAKTVTPPPSLSSGGKEEGCYLVYDSDGAKLMLNYSRAVVPGAVGFFSPGLGKKIQGFKFKQNCGRSELIGNCAAGVAGRKNYYSGWCQYLRLASLMNGSVTAIPLTDSRQGLEVDVFVYRDDARPGQQTVLLEECAPYEVSDSSKILAVACLPKHTEFQSYLGLTVALNKWMTEASTAGAASRFD